MKTNIGHLEAAAGIAGFIKAALSVQHAQIPPNLNFSKWNPAIDPAPTRLYVPTELADWPDSGRSAPAAVSSFGLGGTNAHVVLEQAPNRFRPRRPPRITTGALGQDGRPGRVVGEDPR